MRRARIGFIGAGWWATTNHMPLLAARPDVDLVGVCSLGPALDRIRQRFGFAFATVDYRELLQHDLDGVIVSTPHHLHFEHAKAGLGRGLHVMCEKPMALQADQAWVLVNLAKEVDRQLLVPYGWHYKDHVQAARKLLASVGIGEIESVVSIMASPTKAFFAGGGDGPSVPAAFEPTLVDPDPATWQTPERGGGYLHGQLTHSTAMMFWLTGLRANEVSCLMTKPASAVDMYDAATVRFDGGALGTISGNATLPDGDPFHLVLQLFGTEGVLLLDLSNDEVSLRRHDGRNERIACAPNSGHYSCEGPPNRFVDLILGGGENESPGQAAALSVELLAAMKASADFGGRMVDVH